jgi:aminoglycoside 2'-N-acetyltransferase I
MQIDCSVHALDSLPRGDQRHLADCFQQHFGHVAYEWAPLPWRCLATVDGELVGHLAVLKRTVTAGDTPIDVGGIGAVTTHEAWRRLGVASALLDRAAHFMRDDLAVPFGLLICRPTVADVYTSSGWRVVPAETRFTQPSSTATYPGLTMTLSLRGDQWPAGDIDLQGLPW